MGIQEELDLKGIAHIGGPADAGKQVTLKAGEFMEHAADVSGGSCVCEGGEQSERNPLVCVCACHHSTHTQAPAVRVRSAVRVMQVAYM